MKCVSKYNEVRSCWLFLPWHYWWSNNILSFRKWISPAFSLYINHIFSIRAHRFCIYVWAVKVCTYVWGLGIVGKPKNYFVSLISQKLNFLSRECSLYRDWFCEANVSYIPTLYMLFPRILLNVLSEFLKKSYLRVTILYIHNYSLLWRPHQLVVKYEKFYALLRT